MKRIIVLMSLVALVAGCDEASEPPPPVKASFSSPVSLESFDRISFEEAVVRGKRAFIPLNFGGASQNSSADAIFQIIEEFEKQKSVKATLRFVSSGYHNAGVTGIWIEFEPVVTNKLEAVK